MVNIWMHWHETKTNWMNIEHRDRQKLQFNTIIVIMAVRSGEKRGTGLTFASNEKWNARVSAQIYSLPAHHFIWYAETIQRNDYKRTIHVKNIFMVLINKLLFAIPSYFRCWKLRCDSSRTWISDKRKTLADRIQSVAFPFLSVNGTHDNN